MSAFDFHGRVAVITGGTSGIGMAAVRQFRAAGAQVVLTGQDASRVAAAQRELPDVLAVLADARRVEDAVALGQQIRARHGRVDALFLNAGIFSFRPLDDLTEAYVDDMIGTNLKGLIFTLKELAPLMPGGASVVLNASTFAHKGVPGSAVYTATKGAITAMTRALAAELGPRGIRVNSVSPGATFTDGLGKAGLSQQAVAASTAHQAVPRLATADEIASAVLFLCASQAAYATGSDVRVDGGFAV